MRIIFTQKGLEFRKELKQETETLNKLKLHMNLHGPTPKYNSKNNISGTFLSPSNYRTTKK